MSTDKRQDPAKDDQKGPKVTIKQKGPRIERDPAKDAGKQAQTGDQARQEVGYAGPSPEEENLREQMARLQADFTNFKQRTERDRLQMVADAHGDLAVQLLPVIDNFDRAAEHVPEQVKNDPWYTGVEGIRKQFNDLLKELGIERIEAVGQPFDPELHEALGHEPNDEYGKDVVTKEFEAGYKMGEKVIRPAKVQVSSGKQGS
ncbi:MAG: nucleotide exchange factor GrpE [bacterium]|nr:nucleotide exchange factor GrpE [bacterium]